MALEFLPGWPPMLAQAALFGALLIIALVAGEALSRYASLPRITGYVLAGALLGPAGTGLLGESLLSDLRLLVDLAIGLIVFELGFRLQLDWLRRNRWLLVTAIAESVFCFAGIFATLVFFDFRPLLAAMAAAIGTATSPAVVMLVAHELRAEGQITERMYLFTAVNTAFAYVALTLLLPFLHVQHEVAWQSALLHPAYLLTGAFLTGAAAAFFTLHVAAWLGKREDRQFVLLVAMAVLTIGLAYSLRFSVTLSLLMFGMLARNLDYRHVLLPVRFGHGAQLFFLILFVLTGASLQFTATTLTAVAIMVAYIAVRFLGKAVALVLFGHLSGIRSRGAGLLAVALVPMSGIAVVMVRDTTILYPEFGRELAAVVLSAVALLELFGPLATQFALRQAGEARPDG